ncbi:hypothetical protein QAD02_010337 [Eretmocerus hayati]|uniref:Uncharacterized protein n=1 Tax=Eretmocerus hayati TaxID=131215 RepID=A0ACC2NEA6_9HYME|nr:hypothetical protein QAD02_010337 [Eretmocerus hayati]
MTRRWSINTSISRNNLAYPKYQIGIVCSNLNIVEKCYPLYGCYHSNDSKLRKNLGKIENLGKILDWQDHTCRSEPHGNELSFVVFIQLRRSETSPSEPLCTGSLISKKHILTAEHCFKALRSPYLIEVLIGSPELKNCKVYVPKSWTTYKKWAWLKNRSLKLKHREYGPEVDDIAIITLYKEIKEKVKVAKLTSKNNEKFYETGAQLARWSVHPPYNEMVLVKTDAHIISLRKCEKFASILKRSEVFVHETELCGTIDSSITLAADDVGAPLFYKDRTIVGVLKGACSDDNCSGAIQVFSGLHHYKKFIDSILKE